MPEFKRASKVWKKKEEETPRKCKEVPTMSKVLAMVFWNCRGILLIGYLLQGINPGTEKKYHKSTMVFLNHFPPQGYDQVQATGLLSKKSSVDP